MEREPLSVVNRFHLHHKRGKDTKLLIEHVIILVRADRKIGSLVFQ
jgi:hypothetical protein